MSTPSSLTAWERWELASFDAPDHGHTATSRHDAVPPAPTFSADELAEIKADAYRAGFEEGRSAGFSNGQAEGRAEGKSSTETLGRAEIGKLVDVTRNFEQQLAEMDAAVAAELMALSLEIARKVIVQTLRARPETIIAVIHEALSHLPLQHATIHLHPEDASLARTYAGDQLAHVGHRVHENPRLKRGDVVIDAGGSHLDATLATRWRRVLDELGQDSPWIDESKS